MLAKVPGQGASWPGTLHTTTNLKNSRHTLNKGIPVAGDRILRGHPDMVRAEARVGRGLKVPPAAIESSGGSLDDKAHIANRSQRVRRLARGEHDARIEVGAHGIEDHKQSAILILHHRAKGSRSIPAEGEVAALREISQDEAGTMYYLDLSPQDAGNDIREERTAIADSCIDREGDQPFSTTHAV